MCEPNQREREREREREEKRSDGCFACGGYSGREILCNESSDIIELFNSGFDGVAAAGSSSSLDLSPPSLKGQIKEWNRIIYPNVNNGVYRCGFAQSQEAYDVAVNDLFSILDMLDDHLTNSRYLCGDVLTLADVCLFTTLIRFDLVYNVLFKCTKKKLLVYNNLHGYMRDIYQIPKVASTCNFEAIMDGYFKILFPLNPGGIRPVIPAGSEHEVLSKPHNRGSPLAVGIAVMMGCLQGYGSFRQFNPPALAKIH